MNKTYLLSFFIVISFSFFAQNKFLDSTKVYEYSAIFIDKNGDTLTKEKMIIHPLEKPWIQKTQESYEIKYYPDTSGLLRYISYSEKEQKRIVKLIKRNNFKFWIQKNEITGGTEDTINGSLFLHSPRGNQYEYTQLAPLPHIVSGSLSDKQMEYSTVLYYFGSIPPSAGKFKGEYKCYYTTIPIIDYSLGNQTWKKCWKVKAYNTHKNINPNYLDAIYNKIDGFLLLHYRFFDNTQIIIQLEKIRNSKKIKP